MEKYHFEFFNYSIRNTLIQKVLLWEKCHLEFVQLINYLTHSKMSTILITIFFKTSLQRIEDHQGPEHRLWNEALSKTIPPCSKTSFFLPTKV